ncbi:bZIP transcription factor RISBZ1 isoform X3 [Elaeis guineensis]|uniref:bZIP transcription factor RISBZ1 isoform X3 n=1 Tax=Elaeis guineensis var. tenera TaxID=51953 RepID=UPI003C6D242D
MERVFSGDEMSDSFWAAAAGLPSPAAGGRPRGLMNRSPSEWYFEKFLEVAEEEAAIPRTTPPPPANPNLDPDYNRNPPPASAVASNSSGGGRKDGGRGEDDELVEIKEPAVVAAAAPPQGPPSDPPADVDPKEYAALLKQRLDLYRAAVATCRGSGVNSPDSSSLDSKSLSLDASQLGSQGPVQDVAPYFLSNPP